MRPRWLFYAPILALVLAVAGIGLLLGARLALTTETEVIERVAARYVAESSPQAQLSDCHARPAQSEGLWLVVLCAPVQGRGGVAYFIDRFGRVRDQGPVNGQG
ncbi:hypothetical protein HAT86_00330 [Roseovarius gahaiensis]|uniref:Uncharacterized protein n=1 Tax=Roseovarius gahaiensis TaxID=2716691 RepID=A0A967BEC2_9RHOB|nr:hypothetical protein [Roseovarius gahaiensis]